MDTMRQSRIRPLPSDVAARLKSATAITRLVDVVLELAENALDAGAGGIAVSVDFTRGACTVEDDGVGIPAAEFERSGSLAVRHCVHIHSPPFLAAPLTARHLQVEPPTFSLRRRRELPVLPCLPRSGHDYVPCYRRVIHQHADL